MERAAVSTAPAERAADTVRAALTQTGLEWEESRPRQFAVTLPGEKRQRTTVSLVVGAHSVSINAFVARSPEENHEALYRWLLSRNVGIYAVAFAIDRLGDVYLVGRLPLTAVNAGEIDRILGSVLEHADGSFNTILELGFATAIRREWQWRSSRGESTANLAAFGHLLDRDTS